MFPPKKKKPGLDVTIVAGGPKKGAGDDIGDPGPLEPPKKKPGLPSASPSASPSAPPPPAAPPPDDDEGAEPGSEHEAGESPAYESTEEQGAKLISDIEQAGQQFGLDGQTSREFAASVFDAMANCLRGGGGGDEGGMGADMGGGAPPMPGGYGR